MSSERRTYLLIAAKHRNVPVTHTEDSADESSRSEYVAADISVQESARALRDRFYSIMGSTLEAYRIPDSNDLLTEMMNNAMEELMRAEDLRFLGRASHQSV